MADLGSIPDDECTWHSTGVGPMRIERQSHLGSAWHHIWFVWRRQNDGSQVFCGAFPIEDEAKTIARILSAVSDADFTKAAQP